jgi:arginine-tRNA-protein transferase
MLVSARFTTDPETCPYLHDRPSRLEVRWVARISPAEQDAELEAGFRRFGRTLFRPACGACQECIPLRILVKEFQPSRSQRRVLRRNQDVVLEVGAPELDDARIELYQRFHGEREKTRGWPPSRMDGEEYFGNFLDNVVPTSELRYRVGGALVAVAYVEETPRALNSIYAYYDPRCARRSLGTFDVLKEIEAAAAAGKDFVYLGLYVQGCQSMAYKRSFRPCELLIDGHWERVD